MNFFDLHCDTISECEHTGQGLYENNLALSLSRGRCFERWTQVFALFVPERLRGESAFDYTQRLYARFRAELERNRGRAVLCRGAGEAERAHREKKCACLLSIEGGNALGGDPEKVAYFYGLGVRFLTLTWDGRNELGGGSRSDGGLTERGRAVLTEMERCGMAADLSHLNEETFWQVCACTDGPVLATHSDCFSCLPHLRNLRDAQIAEIIRRRGLIGLNLYPEFLGPGDPAERIRTNILHLLKLGGEDCIAFGCDFDGAPMAPGFETVDTIPRLYRLLRESGVREPLLKKCFFENAHSFLKRCWP
ncbi:MAG TPA: membrane dipeptidase [Candidatus Onthovicinus excrementipullorum]|nr:membrane dipeptidase [Candidatus Onthovicinus excrementipullorum]